MLRIHAVAQARGGAGAAVAVIVGVVRAAGLAVKAAAARMGQAQRIVQRALGPGRAAHAGLDLARTLVAQADADIGRRRAFALAGEQLDDTANGVRAIHRRGRAAQHLDAFDLRERNLLPHCAAGGLRVDAHTVDIHGCKALLGTAHIHAAGIAHAAVARDFDAGQARQQVGHPGGAAGLDGLPVDDGHIGHQVRQSLLGARGRHHGFGELRGAQVLREKDGSGNLLSVRRMGSEKRQRSKDNRTQRRNRAHVGQMIFHGKHKVCKQPGPASPPAYG